MAQNDFSADNCLYFDITKQERDSAVRYLLGTIIKSRQDSPFPSNHYTYDEDVNVYMAHLLFAISLPEYHEMAEPYLSMNSSDILESVRSTEDRTIRYFIFKVNADHILMHSTIFDDLAKTAPSDNKIFRRSAKHYRELARLYYDQAAAYHKRIYRKKTGVGEVLQKLSDYFDAYQGLLKRVRGEYFDFMHSFRDQAFTHFMHDLNSYEGQESKKVLMDRFLELYGQWLEVRDPETARNIEKVAEELKRVDPEFLFNADQELYGRGGGYGNERKCA